MSVNVDFRIMRLPFESKTDLLALGAEAKNTFALVKGNKLLVSGNNGDLEDMDNLLGFEKGVGAALKKFKLRPRRLLADMHPEYLSTKFAQEFCRRHPASIEFIQHHHAHAASCAFENNQSGRAIGVIFDGTGFGEDGNLWGGEFLVFDFKNFRRFAQLKYLPLAGGSKPIREPWRLAAAWLYAIYGKRLSGLKIDFVKRLPARKLTLFKQMLDRNINCPLTSSMGRLFDAIAAITGIKEFATYEAEAAIALEKSASRIYPKRLRPYEAPRAEARGFVERNTERPFSIRALRGRGFWPRMYKFSLREASAGLIVDPIPIFKQVVADLQKRAPREAVALKFHYAVAQMIKEVCILIRKKEKLSRVFLSGGVFQNRILFAEAAALLRGAGFEVFKNLSSPSDSSLSIGQAIIGAHRARKV